MIDANQLLDLCYSDMRDFLNKMRDVNIDPASIYSVRELLKIVAEKAEKVS